MGRKSILDLSSEETLAECVRKYPCLYDKTCKHYKDKHCVENAWAEVDKELGYEEGIDNSIAKINSTKFKKTTTDREKKFHFFTSPPLHSFKVT